jgi:hypothetical protein
MNQCLTSLSDLRGLLGVALFMVLACIDSNSSCDAQDFRIYTCVQRLSSANNAQTSEVVARSLTLFHAGKSYDYMDDVGELIVFEPALERFTILHGKLMKVTTVEFAQLKQFLRVAETETQKCLTEMTRINEAKATIERDFLLIQLKPDFDEQWDSNKQELVLKSAPLTYKVKCAEKVQPEFVKAYLSYADWMAQLNSILHPQTLMPGPRIALNAALRKQQKIPVSVELESDVQLGIHLKADHNIRWELDTIDRSRITDWERLILNPQVETISFHNYQRLWMTSQGMTTSEK